VSLAELGPWIGGVFAAVGGTAGIVSFIKARPEAKKIDADAAKVIQETSAEMVKAVRESVREDLATLRARVAELERKERTQEVHLRIHERWDLVAVRQARDNGWPLADPPPLYPDPATA
jgi:hypothetical protein